MDTASPDSDSTHLTERLLKAMVASMDLAGEMLHESRQFEVMKKTPTPAEGAGLTKSTVVCYRSRREK